MNLSLPAIALLLINLGLLWLLMAAPIGRRTIRRELRLQGDGPTIFQLLQPKAFARWNPSVKEGRAVDGAAQMELLFRQPDRHGQPISRTVETLPAQADAETLSIETRVVSDSALDESFWKNFHDRRTVRMNGNTAIVAIEQTDRYRGLGGYIFRWLMLRRETMALKAFVEQRPYSGESLLAHHGLQFLLAVLSTLMLWPFFGLTPSGLALSTMLTMVIILHELGHMAAYRAFGHKRVRMIFIPLLGGVAIGGRPYNSHFEVATCALMGPGMSAFFVPVLVALGSSAHAGYAPNATEAPTMAMLLVLGAFNLMNLLPMSRFDGGQVLRQIFHSRGLLATASFGITLAVMFTGWRIGVPASVLFVTLAIFTLMSLWSIGGVKPKRALDPMTGPERLLTGFGLYAAVLIHAYAVVFACDQLFG